MTANNILNFSLPWFQEVSNGLENEYITVPLLSLRGNGC